MLLQNIYVCIEILLKAVLEYSILIKERKTRMKISIRDVKDYKLFSAVSIALKSASEFLYGYFTFRNVGPLVTVYGSARFKPNDDYYKLGVEVGKKLALNGIGVMTGGGPGIMEAANKGAKEAGGGSYGCRISILTERSQNSYLDCNLKFKYFFTRKYMLARFSIGFIALPGGFGTMDELFEMLTLVCTEKIKRFPIVLIGVEYWKPLLEYLDNTFVKNGVITAEELKLIYLTDSIDEAINYIQSKFAEIPNEKKQ